MNILIAKANEEIIKGLLPTAKFDSATKNTSRFRCSESRFMQLYTDVKLMGYNPFALMSW